MPRATKKEIIGSAARSDSKRPAPESPSRQTKRVRAARKSYVEPDTDIDDTDDAPKNSRKKAVATEDEDEVMSSDFDDNNDNEPSSESEPDESASEEDDVKAKKSTPRGRNAKQSNQKAQHADLLKPGAKLPPGTQVIIKKPKARGPGNTPYVDETIHPNTMLFLTDLAANNDRTWLKCMCTFATISRCTRHPAVHAAMRSC